MGAITPTAYKTGMNFSRNPTATATDSGKPRFKVGFATLADTVDATDTTSIDVYAQWGITKVLVVREYVHTTTNSVVAEETLATTAVTGTTLTVTVPAGSNDDKRFIAVYGI